MKCPNCGTEIEDTDELCPYCGTLIVHRTPPVKKNTHAVPAAAPAETSAAETDSVEPVAEAEQPEKKAKNDKVNRPMVTLVTGVLAFLFSLSSIATVFGEMRGMIMAFIYLPAIMIIANIVNSVMGFLKLQAMTQKEKIKFFVGVGLTVVAIVILVTCTVLAFTGPRTATTA